MSRAILAVALALGAVWALERVLGPILAALVIGPPLCLGVIGAFYLADRAMDRRHPPVTRVRRLGPVVDVSARVRR